MLARDLTVPYPTVQLSDSALSAARLLARQDLPGLIVVDERGRPVTVLPGSQVLRMAVPAYCIDDPALARVIDEAAADVFVRALADRTVADVLPTDRRELSVVGPQDTALEIAALMARSRTPLVAVVGEDHTLLGAITLAGLLDRILADDQ